MSAGLRPRPIVIAAEAGEWPACMLAHEAPDAPPGGS